MKLIALTALAVSALAVAGCDQEELVLSSGCDSTSGVSAGGECDCTNGTEDLDSPADCPWNLGWPCGCVNNAECQNGTHCIGNWPEGGSSAGLCAPKCSVAGVDEVFGMPIVEVCGTYLAEDECLPVLSGCESNADCPELMVCIEPSCIAFEPGCEDGAGEVKVCFPDNL